MIKCGQKHFKKLRPWTKSNTIKSHLQLISERKKKHLRVVTCTVFSTYSESRHNVLYTTRNLTSFWVNKVKDKGCKMCYILSSSNFFFSPFKINILEGQVKNNKFLFLLYLFTYQFQWEASIQRHTFKGTHQQ